MRWPARKDKENARRKARYQLNPAAENAVSRQYHETHRDEIRQQQAGYRDTHREGIRARNTQYSKTRRNRDAELARLAKWVKALSPEKRKSLARQAAQRRMARKAGLPATLTREQWAAIKEAYGHRCAYCGNKVARLTQDHVVPITRGGGYVADNIVPACGSCNSRKGDREPVMIPALRLMF